MEFSEQDIYLSFTILGENILKIFRKDLKQEEKISNIDSHTVKIYISRGSKKILVIHNCAIYILEIDEAKIIEINYNSDIFFQ